MTPWVAFVSVGVGVSQRILLSVLTRNPQQRACAWDLPRDRKRTKERRSQGQSAGESSQEKVSQEMGKEGTSQQVSKRCMLRPIDLQIPGWPTQEDKSALLVVCWCFARVHGHVSPQKHWIHKSVTDLSLLALGANPSPWLFVLLFFHPLGCVWCGLCVGKEMWNTPGQRWGKPLDDSNGHE